MWADGVEPGKESGSRRRALLCTLEVGHSDEAIGVRFEVLAAMKPEVQYVLVRPYDYRQA